MAELGQLEIAKIPADQAIKGTPSIPVVTYPAVEEMTFRGIIKSEAEGMALLRAIQILVYELGAATIIQVVGAIEKKPDLLAKAKSYLPYITMLT